MNAGAQKCVTHRVKNTPGVGPPAGTPEKTRTWSMAIKTITAPRMMSIDAIRFRVGVSAAAVARGAASGAYDPRGAREVGGEATPVILGSSMSIGRRLIARVHVLAQPRISERLSRRSKRRLDSFVRYVWGQTPPGV